MQEHGNYLIKSNNSLMQDSSTFIIFHTNCERKGKAHDNIMPTNLP